MKKLIVNSIIAIVVLIMIAYLVFCTFRNWSVLTCWLDRMYYLFADCIALVVVVFLGRGIASMFED